MIEYRITTNDDIELLMESRLTQIRKNISQSEVETAFLNSAYTLFALDGSKIAGCASISYITMMPTFSHPTGKRAHLMNVYSDPEYRGQGIAKKMVSMLIDEAWSRGATEISLDATKMGRPLYEKLGFYNSTEAMAISKK